MKSVKYKVSIDIFSMICVLGAIITGFVLHKEVWHLYIYDNRILWSAHEFIGLLLVALMAIHCVQHSFWFKNYAKIKPEKKRVTTILLIIAGIVALSGIVLMCGSRSEMVSHIHYLGAILFSLLVLGHVLKRWKIFKSLI